MVFVPTLTHHKRRRTNNKHLRPVIEREKQINLLFVFQENKRSYERFNISSTKGDGDGDGDRFLEMCFGIGEHEPDLL